MIGSRASQNAIVNQVMKNANGIGTSKVQAKNSSQIKGQNGQSVSTKNHSIKSEQNMRSVVKQYTSFVKSNYEGKIAGNLTSESMEKFISSKIEEGIALSSINTYISALAKISDNLNELGVSATSRESITSYRDELIKEFGSLQSIHENRAYSDPQQIVDTMHQNTPYGLSTELQLQAGLRSDDAINISDKITINADNTLNIQGSKGGISYTTKELPSELIERVERAIEQGYSVSYSEYKDTLKEEVSGVGQDWNGTHGLRYSYAQSEYQSGVSKEEISLNLGHSRESITDHYLK